MADTTLPNRLKQNHQYGITWYSVPPVMMYQGHGIISVVVTGTIEKPQTGDYFTKWPAYVK